jgi:hypothetical protein
MNKYLWRKNFTAVDLNHERLIRAKLAIKTKELDWIETQNPVVILVSVHSAFHEEIYGDFKMEALLSTIKSHVKGKILVLFSDRAHLRTFSLNCQQDLKLALDSINKDAQLLNLRYQSYFENCEIAYWHSYISQDDSFFDSLTDIKNFYQTDLTFRELVDQDAADTYTIDRSKMLTDRELYTECAKEDILEQCACLLVLSKKGYRFQFYPGKPYASVEYTNNNYISEDKRISWINVFLSIEKKTIIEQPALGAVGL